MSLQGVQYRRKMTKILTGAVRKSSLQALVTGATGFIGSHLVEALVQRGFRVRCLVRPTSHLAWVKGLPVEIIYGDCQEKDSLGPGVKDVDLVFHLAGATRAIDAKTYFTVNALGTENLVRACLEHNTRIQNLSIFPARQPPVRRGTVGRKGIRPLRPGLALRDEQAAGRGISPIPGPCTSSPDPPAFCGLRAQG